uniref:WAP domain-containing protein n=1 Tax=Romanomermis culicivorax TaxID=13658 RepID=A0A915I3Z2_ROMCU
MDNFRHSTIVYVILLFHCIFVNSAAVDDAQFNSLIEKEASISTRTTIATQENRSTKSRSNTKEHLRCIRSDPLMCVGSCRTYHQDNWICPDDYCCKKNGCCCQFYVGRT